MNALLKDLRYALRTLLRNPAFSLVAVVTLALAIGVNTAIFGLVQAVLLRPLDIPEGDRIAMVYETNLAKGWERFTAAPANYLDWKIQARAFEQMAAVQAGNLNLTGGDRPERVRGARASADLIPMLGIPPLMGRSFTAEEDREGAPKVVVIGESLWRERLGADPKVLGRVLTLDGEARTVIGVMPARFRVLQAQLWVPMAWDAATKDARGSHNPLVMARLAPGATFESAQREMTALAEGLARRYPETNAGWGVRVSPLFEEVVGGARRSLLILLGAAGFVLLIACANIANLLLVRGAVRAREISIRSALGASRARLVRQLLTETLLLSLLGGAVGLLVAMWGIDLMGGLGGLGIPRASSARIDLPVLAFSLGATLLTGLLFGLAPALRASRARVHAAWKEGNRVASGRDALRSAVAAGEIGVALVLLIGAGLLLKTLHRLGEADPGFASENLLTASLSLPPSRYPEPDRQATFYAELLDRIARIHGVDAVAASSSLPLSNGPIFAFFIDGKPLPAPADVPSANWFAVSADYFHAMRIPVIAGRGFSSVDRAGAVRVAVINQTMARRFFSGESPIGHTIRFGNASATPRLIVGVVGDVAHFGAWDGTTAQMYEPFLQEPFAAMGVALRFRGVPEPADAVRREVAALDKDLPIFDVRTMTAALDQTLASQRSYTILLVIFAILALTLATIGIYGVISFAVAQRTHEIGVRVALGAARSDILRLIVGHGARLLVLGMGAGLLAAFALTRLIRTMLFEVEPVDLPTYVALSLLLGVVALGACYLPARRAARVDPVVALRCD